MRALDPGIAADPSIFRDYDVRGVVGEGLDGAVATGIGRAVAAMVRDAGEHAVWVARDGRLSSPGLRDALVEGLRDGGVDVVDLGLVPTPVLYYATHTGAHRSGVMVTGSHSAPEWNGFKIVVAGETLAGDHVAALARRMDVRAARRGERRDADLVDAYVDRIASTVRPARPLRVVADCGHGAAAEIFPRLLAALGCEVVPLCCEIDGRFPVHHPDPARAENLVHLRARVRETNADLGVALDGDGDRLGTVDETGEIHWPDEVLMLLAPPLLAERPGATVVFDVKCTRHLADVVAGAGGRPSMGRTGHARLKAAMTRTRAPIGGEYSGHLCFADRWFGFDDGLYAAARLIEHLAALPDSAREAFAALPRGHVTPEILLPVPAPELSGIAQAAVAAVREAHAGSEGRVRLIDGVRVDYNDGFALVRASNTTAALTLRFEGDTPAILERITGRFSRILSGVDPRLAFSA